MKNYPRLLAQTGSIAVLAGLTLQAFASNPQPVPEPGPLGLLVFGAVALLVARRISYNN